MDNFLVGSIALAILILTQTPTAAGTYTIDGEFNGCDYEKLYELREGGVLECKEYNYFYEYSPEVRTDGDEVILIGDEKVEAVVRDGSVIETKVAGEFEGCDFDKKYFLENGFVFVCASYNYSYSYMPDVRIFLLPGEQPRVFINDEKYDGSVFRTK